MRASREYLGLLLAVAALVVLFGAAGQHFLSVATFRTIASQIPDAVLLATGMAFVVIAGGIDLSVGSVLALSMATMGVALARGWPLWSSVIACVAAGAACGAVNGLVVARWRVPSFIVTLGMLEMARGGAYLVTGSRTQYIGGTIEAVQDATFLWMPLPVVAAIAAVVIGQFVLSTTVFGRYVTAIGANEEAARLSGINPVPIRFAVFALSGALSGVAAVAHSARLGAADPNAGAGFELRAIAAVVIGGTSLMGGRGSVVGACLGVLIMAVLANGLAQIGVQEPAKRLITGAVIIAAVLLDQYRYRGNT